MSAASYLEALRQLLAVLAEREAEAIAAAVPPATAARGIGEHLAAGRRRSSTHRPQ